MSRSLSDEERDVARERDSSRHGGHTLLVTLHGGCFVGGSASWDGPQTRTLRCALEGRAEVHQLEFDTTSLDACMADLRSQIAELVAAHARVRVVGLGRSSGGYMAKLLLEEGVLDKCVYLAPVLDPATRGALVPALGERAAPFFACRPDGRTEALRKWDPDRELLYLATRDENVPRECFSEEQLRHAMFPGPATHKGMITTVSSSVIGAICGFVMRA